MREIPFTNKAILVLFILIAVCIGGLIDYWKDHKLDNWIHDSALIYQARESWDFASIVVLDDAVPLLVGRKQALPLFARAAEHIIAAGAKGIFLDSRVSKEMEGRMPFAACVTTDVQVQWSEPGCSLGSTNQCLVRNSQLGNAPLKMNAATLTKFSIAPYLGDASLPDFLLFGWEDAAAIPAEGLVVSDRLVTLNDPIARWFDLSADHAVIKMANYISPELVTTSFANTQNNENCDNGRLCRRIRLSRPVYQTSNKPQRLILPVSLLASCDTNVAQQAAQLLTNKVVIFQTTSPAEATDIIVTPMTTALLGPKAMTPGAQYLADAVETFLKQDHPRAPEKIIKFILLLSAAILSVLGGAYLQQTFMWALAGLVFISVSGLCFINPQVQLWPVAATMLTFLTGAGEIIGVHLMIGLREGKLISHYMPKQIHNLLISLKDSDSFHNKRCHAVVLMSDLAGYTTVTGLLKEPALVLKLMNEYLDETSFVLQNKYNGWLESYVGDMVCYYWPSQERNQLAALQDALQGAIELAQLQKKFFSTLDQRFKDEIDAPTLDRIRMIINAGIGLSTGEVVMGDLGPKHGVRKFGIIGDPLNLASRIESLTRLFNTEIIVSEDFSSAALNMGYAIRRLGKIKLKGREKPEILYAFGDITDSRFDKKTVQQWELWLSAIENKQQANSPCPEIFCLDQKTINLWRERNLLGDNGVWYLDEK
jgi:adenylate cyclase